MFDRETEEYIEFISKQYDLLIYKVAYEILKDEDLVQDVKQQVLLKCVPRVQMLKDIHPKQRTSYIATIAKNEAINELRRKESVEFGKEKLYEAYQRYPVMDHVDFHAFEEKYGFGEVMWELLNQMPDMDRDLMVYKFYYRLTTEEIAKEFGTNYEQVKKRFARGKQKLIKLIEKRMEEKGDDWLD